VEAEDGPSALALYEQVNPDIVLLDVMMPEMDGFEVCKAMRLPRNGDGVPIVMVTGVDDFRSIKRAYEAGATDFVTKPISWLILTERVRYMLRASRDAKDLRTSQRLLSNAQKTACLASWEWDQRKGTFPPHAGATGPNPGKSAVGCFGSGRHGQR
jgi:PleD family two-component response regulator